MPKNIDEIDVSKVLSFSGLAPTVRGSTLATAGFSSKETRNSDVHYDLPMPSLEFVARVNELAPDDSELEFLEE